MYTILAKVSATKQEDWTITVQAYVETEDGNGQRVVLSITDSEYAEWEWATVAIRTAVVKVGNNLKTTNDGN